MSQVAWKELGGEGGENLTKPDIQTYNEGKMKTGLSVAVVHGRVCW